MSAAAEHAQALANMPEEVGSAGFGMHGGEDGSIDAMEDISMEDVMSGRGAQKKPVANEEADIPKVESQTV